MFDNLYLNIKDRYNNSSLFRRIANGSFWSFSGTAVAKLVVLIAGILCARILGKDEYGELGMIRSTINMFVILGISGFGLTATKFISQYRQYEKDRIVSIYLITRDFSVFTAVIVCSLIFLFSSYIANETLKSPYLTSDIRCGALLLFFAVLNGVQSGVLTGFENFKSIAINTLIGSVFEGALMCAGAYYLGVTGAILGFGTGYVALYVCNKLSINKTLRLYNLSVKYKYVNKKDLQLIYQFSLPALLSSLMVGPVYWITKSMLVREGGYGALAIYDAADQWRIMILFIPSAISQIVLPILSSMSQGKNNSYWKVLNINILFNGGVAAVLTIMVCCLGNVIMGLYGKGFTDTPTLIILACSTIFSSIASVIGLSISSRNKMWIGFSFNLFWGLMFLSLTYVFLKQSMGAVGVALALLISYIIHSSLQYTYLKLAVKREFKK